MIGSQAPVRSLIAHAVGGGWGKDDSGAGLAEVAIIRGADFPAVSIGDVTGLPIRWEEERKVPQRTLRPGDIVLEISGGTNERPTGRTVFVSERLLSSIGRPTIPASFCRLVRVDPRRADPEYVFWWLQGMYADGRTWAYQNRSTGIANFQFEYFLDTEIVRLPPTDEQRAIATTLAALDERIESNFRLASIIPQLIRARVIAAMQEGVDPVAVSSLASFVNGGAYTKGASGAGRMVIRIAELNNGPGGSTVYNDIDVPADKTARPGDILMSWSGSLGVYRWAREEAIVNQHIFKVIPKGYPAWLVFDRLQAVIDVFRGIAKDKATTMGHIQRGHLNSTFVEVPSRDVLRRLDTELRDLWERLLVAEQESLTVAALRDALLPELLAGRVGSWSTPHD